MFRPHQLSRLRATRLIAPRLVSSRDPICCTNGFRMLASSQRRPISPSTTRPFATTPHTRREAPSDPNKQPPSAKDAVLEPASPSAPEATEREPEPGPQPPSPKPQKRSRRGVIYAALFLFLGTTIGSLFRLSISPPPLPVPGTEQDDYVVASIHSQASKLAIVKTLSADPSWTSWDAYTGEAAAESRNGSNGLATRLTSGAMSGSRGLAYQRIFLNQATGEIVSVVYFGGAMAGWPGVVHGGALATVLDESLGRCAILQFPARTGVTARLELTYKQPTLTNAFYVVRTRPVVGEDSDDAAKSDRKLWVEGSLETEKGKVCVGAKALFVVPKRIKLRRLDDGF